MNTRAARHGPRWQSPLSLLLAGLLALGMFVGSEWAYQNSMSAFTYAGERQAVRTSVQKIMRRLLDMESAQRGYLLTGRPQYLEPFQAAASDIRAAFEQLLQPDGIDADLRVLVHALQESVKEKTSEVEATITLYDAGSHDNWRELMLTDIGREKMDAVRAAAEDLLNTEDRRINDARAAVASALDVGRLGVHGLTLISLLAYALFLRKNAALQSTQDEHEVDMQAERDSLESQVRHRTVELTELNRELQMRRDDERGGLARILHDDLGALLTAAKLDITRLRRSIKAATPEIDARLQHLTEALDAGIVLKRQLMDELMPPALHNLGLPAALEHCASVFQSDTGVPVERHLQPIRLNGDDELALFAVARGALSNAQRHAAATQVSMRLASEGAHSIVEVQDNGQGFSGPWSERSAHGLKNLRHRIEALGGKFLVQSGPDAGTLVRASLPLRLREDSSPTVNRATTSPS